MKSSVAENQVIWITGFPGAGKTTVAKALADKMRDTRKVILLDGDVLREIFNNKQYDLDSRLGLASSYARLCAELAKQNNIVIIATVSMFDQVRDWNRQHIDNYLEVFLDVDIELLIERDQKGLYSSALKQEQGHVIGVNLEYEVPKSPDLTFKDEESSPEQMAVKILERLVQGSLA